MPFLSGLRVEAIIHKRGSVRPFVWIFQNFGPAREEEGEERVRESGRRLFALSSPCMARCGWYGAK